ncbi:hypothetical protein C4580_01375 [Candidatus Woesearchaeota archaeon]|nr:MAG: hypothetical protein C4580_01375 [Candidatus Woesearchaeota archaeon]
MVAFAGALAFLADPQKMLVVTSSAIVAVLLLLAWRRFERPAILYAHVFFVLSPLFYFALSVNCSFGVLNGFLSWCTALFAKFVLYGIPPVLALSIICGYLVLPQVHRLAARPMKTGMFAKLCKRTNIRAGLFVRKSGIPEAFTIGRDIFVSVGLFDVLTAKEVEAVLLHELYHVRSGASARKWSVLTARVFSPIAWFGAALSEEEERNADAFAAMVQRSSRYVKSARAKLS